jgi:non-ribosomal peptide synthase protein (TIGR01720 family)
VLSDGNARLFIACHHLVIDAVSWRILLEDLKSLHRSLREGRALQLSDRTHSYLQWSTALSDSGHASVVKDEIEYWTKVTRHPIPPIRRDYAVSQNRVDSADSVETQLTKDETDTLLKALPRKVHAQVQEVLLTAIVRGLQRWNGRNGILLDIETHGREVFGEAAIDVSRTVGWFTTLYPMYLNLHRREFAEDLKDLKEQLRSLPRRGVGYGILRYLQKCDALTQASAAEIVFNYLGQFDQMFPAGGEWKLGSEPIGPPRSPSGLRTHLLDISGFIGDGRLLLTFEFSRAVHNKRTIEILAQECISELKSAVVRCSSASPLYTPSEFPLAHLTQSDLDRSLLIRHAVKTKSS